MKKFGILLLAAIFGSIVTLGIFYSFENRELNRNSGLHYMNESTVNSKGIFYANNKEGEFAVPDFTKTSQSVMDAVVHIHSAQTVHQRNRPRNEQLPDYFPDFFNEDFFDRFFSPEQPGQNPDIPSQRRMGSGSGVILKENGYIVTNNHVITNADDIQVTLHDNRSYKANIIGADPSTDLALLKIKETNLSFLPLVNSDNLMVGEWVLAIGNPFNLTSTVTAGIVSAKARNINIMREQYAIESFIQTDAAINAGNSGGALVNLQGGLVGINTAIASPSGTYAGYGFAIPSNIVGKIVEDIMEFGVVQRAYLGVVIHNVDGNYAREKGLNVNEGVYIDSVLNNSSAQKAGIQEGDVIVRINNKEIKRTAQLLEYIALHRPGDQIDIVADRKGKQITTKVTLQSREGGTTVISKQKSEVFTLLGAEFNDISHETMEKLNIKGGVRLSKLHAGILRQQTDIREGFIITKVNNENVRSAKSFISIIENLKGGVMFEGVYEDIKGTYYYAFGL